MKANASLIAVPVLVLAALAGAPRGSLAAQDESSARSCASITDNAERLACYDRAVRAGQAEGTRARGAQAEGSPAVSPGATAAPGVPAASAGTALHTETGSRSRSAAPGGSAQHSETAQHSENAAGSADAAASESPSQGHGEARGAAPPRESERESGRDEATRLQREPPRSSRSEPAEFEIRVVQVRRIQQRPDAYLITDDGDVWRQTDGRRIDFPHPPFRAVITPGSFGSHFLQLPGARFLIRVSEQRPH